MDLKKFTVATLGVAMSISVANAQSVSSETHAAGVTVYTNGSANRTSLTVSKGKKEATGIAVSANGYRDYTSLEMYASGLSYYGYQGNVAFQINSDNKIGIGCAIDDSYFVKLGGSTFINGSTRFNLPATNTYLDLLGEGDEIRFIASRKAERGNPFTDLAFVGSFIRFQAFCLMESGLTVDGKITCRDEIEVSHLSAANMSVEGLKAKDINVEMNHAADYVFDEGYNLKPLNEVESYVKENKHLPGIPSAAEMAEKGMSVSEMSNLLLEKVEELTLHMIQLQKENETLKAKMATLEK